MHVGLLRVGLHQLVEEARGLGQAPAGEGVSGASGELHQRFPRLGDGRREHRHPEHVEAERINHRLSLDVRVYQLFEDAIANLEFFESRQQDAGVVGDDTADFDVAVDAECSRAQQRLERRLVMSEAELAQALHADGAGVLRLARDQRREGIARLGVAIALVERRPEVPPPFVPRGAQREAASVKRDGVVQPSGVAGRAGLRRDAVERGGRRRGRGALRRGLDRGGQDRQ